MDIQINVSTDIQNLKDVLDNKKILPAIKAGVEGPLTQEAMRNFGTESYGGQKWQPLKPRTLADRAAKGFPPAPILYRTGKLKNTRNIEMKSDCVNWHWPTDYASAHQFGVPSSHLPARPFISGLGNTPTDVKAVEKLCEDIVKTLGL